MTRTVQWYREQIMELSRWIMHADIELQPMWDRLNHIDSAIRRTHRRTASGVVIYSGGGIAARRSLFEARLGLAIRFGPQKIVRARWETTLRGYQRELTSLEKEIAKQEKARERKAMLNA
jgi:hypothetical protein